MSVNACSQGTVFTELLDGIPFGWEVHPLSHLSLVVMATGSQRRDRDQRDHREVPQLKPSSTRSGLSYPEGRQQGGLSGSSGGNRRDRLQEAVNWASSVQQRKWKPA